jgi:hypothetical protein
MPAMIAHTKPKISSCACAKGSATRFPAMA